jgi:predicted anti-sigma-YlaC factor YlaD
VETAEDISCQELVELVTEYLEGALSPEDHARFEEHASNCRGCKAYLSQMRETIRLVGRLEREHVSPEAERELREAFHSWRPASG